MSFITPILIVPSVYCACAPLHPTATASAARLINRDIWVSPPVLMISVQSIPWRRSDAEIVVQLLQVGVELGIGEAVDDAAMFHHVVAVRNGRSEAKILLDQQDGETLLLEQADSVADLLNDH